MTGTLLIAILIFCGYGDKPDVKCLHRVLDCVAAGKAYEVGQTDRGVTKVVAGCLK